MLEIVSGSGAVIQGTGAEFSAPVFCLRLLFFLNQDIRTVILGNYKKYAVRGGKMIQLREYLQDSISMLKVLRLWQ